MTVTRFKRVAFRVDASSQIGSGHVNRCLRLGMIFTRNNWQVIFICRQLSGNMIDHIRETGFAVKSLKIENNSLKGCSQEIDAEKTKTFLTSPVCRRLLFCLACLNFSSKSV